YSQGPNFVKEGCALWDESSVAVIALSLIHPYLLS
ncbi:hypothetical protein chiPu_0023724, partial [Chiloscyllium punctatum]|nr:hypothetical protein [Chiloscyllium punctatum]